MGTTNEEMLSEHYLEDHLTTKHRYPSDFLAIAAKAVHCEKCFANDRIKRALVNRAQPRWIGPSYTQASPRVVLMLVNPGGGGSSSHPADNHFRVLLDRFAKGIDPIDGVMKHQGADIPNWNGGKLQKLLSLAGLELDKIALANVAWCATLQNKYPEFMLRNCFSTFTLQTLIALQPNILILSGVAAHKYEAQVKIFLPNIDTVKIPHYAHRKGDEVTFSAAEKIRLAVKQ